jgi:hypothetical protein
MTDKKDLLLPLLDHAEPRAAFRALLDEIFPEDGDVLKRLMERFDRLDKNEYGAFAVMQYEAGYDFTFDLTISEDVANETAFASLNDALDRFAAISGECGGGGMLGFPGWSDLGDFMDEAEDFGGKPVMAFDVGQNIMIGDDGEKNARNEPTLYFIDHEDGEPQRLEGAENFTALQVYLRVLTQHLNDGEKYFEGVDG